MKKKKNILRVTVNEILQVPAFLLGEGGQGQIGVGQTAGEIAQQMSKEVQLPAIAAAVSTEEQMEAESRSFALVEPAVLGVREEPGRLVTREGQY
jgi:hypothetical protein